MIDVDQAVRPRSQRSRVSRFRRLTPALLILYDALIIYLAFVVSYVVRYSLEIGPRIQQNLGFDAYQPLGLLLLVVMLCVLLARGAYTARLSNELADEMTTIVMAGTITIAAIVVITTMTRQYQYSREVMLNLWVLVILMLILGRMIFRGIQSMFFRRGLGVRRLLVVGATDMGKMVMQRVMSRPDLGYQLVGFVDQRAAVSVRDFGRFRALGTVADIPELVVNRQVDDVIVALPAADHEDIWPILRLCEKHEVRFKLVPDLFELSLSQVEVDNIGGIPLLDVQEKPIRQVARAAKRLMDLLVSLATLILAFPLLLVLALLVRLGSRGPIFLRQQRVGLEGRTFDCLKFRTMQVGAGEQQPIIQAMNEADGPIFKIRNDPRVTTVGRWMRRWSLDELPQLWNVLRGDMSLVGPRPPLPDEVERYEPLHRRRLEIKPGMTGIWQVSGRSDLAFDEMVMMDIYYVDNWSPALDVKILFRTVFAVLMRQGAY